MALSKLEKMNKTISIEMTVLEAEHLIRATNESFIYSGGQRCDNSHIMMAHRLGNRVRDAIEGVR